MACNQEECMVETLEPNTTAISERAALATRKRAKIKQANVPLTRTDAVRLLFMGNQLLDRGAFKPAQACFTRLTALHNTNATRTKTKAELLMSSGDTRCEHESTNSISNHLVHTLLTEQEFAEAFCNLGSTLLAQNDNKNALNAAFESLKIMKHANNGTLDESYCAAPLYVRAECFLRTGKESACIECCDAVLKVAPHFFQAMCCRAMARLSRLMQILEDASKKTNVVTAAHTSAVVVAGSVGATVIADVAGGVVDTTVVSVADRTPTVANGVDVDPVVGAGATATDVSAVADVVAAVSNNAAVLATVVDVTSASAAVAGGSSRDAGSVSAAAAGADAVSDGAAVIAAVDDVTSASAALASSVARNFGTVGPGAADAIVDYVSSAVVANFADSADVVAGAAPVTGGVSRDPGSVDVVVGSGIAVACVADSNPGDVGNTCPAVAAVIVDIVADVVNDVASAATYPAAASDVFAGSGIVVAESNNITVSYTEAATIDPTHFATATDNDGATLEGTAGATDTFGGINLSSKNKRALELVATDCDNALKISRRRMPKAYLCGGIAALISGQLDKSNQYFDNARCQVSRMLSRSTNRVKESLDRDLFRIEVAAVVDAAIAIGTAAVLGSGHTVTQNQCLALAHQMQNQTKLGMVQELKKRYFEDFLESWFKDNTIVQGAARKVVDDVLGQVTQTMKSRFFFRSSGL